MLLYSFIWYTVYLVNAAALTVVLFFQNEWKVEVQSYPLSIAMKLCSLMGNVVITDTCTDWLCILLAKATAVPPAPESNSLDTDHPQLEFLVVYCLKSTSPEDIKETLMFLKASWRMNTDYSNAVYCILSGTQQPDLAEAEKNAIAHFNSTVLGPNVRYCYGYYEIT